MIATILERRSVREGFGGEPLPRSTIDQIVECGLVAPSSKNAQPWRIHVVTDRLTLATLADAVQHAKDADRYVPIDPATGRPRPNWPSSVTQSAAVLREVGLALFVENRGEFSDGRQNVASVRDDEVRKNALIGYGFEMIGLGASIQNMWLAASALGLAAVFMGDVVIAEETIRSTLGMRGDLAGVLAIARDGGEPVPKRLAPDRVVRHDLKLHADHP